MGWRFFMLKNKFSIFRKGLLPMPPIKLNIDVSNFFNEAYLPLLNNTERFTVLYGGG